MKIKSDQIMHLITLAEFYHKPQNVIDYLYKKYCEALHKENPNC